MKEWCLLSLTLWLPVSGSQVFGAWKQGVCLANVTVSDLMSSGSEQPHKRPELPAEAERSHVLCMLGGFTCLKAVPRCSQMFCCVISSRKTWLDQAHWILILPAAFCSRSQILICQEKAFSSRTAATNAFLCPFYSSCPPFYILVSSATFILHFLDTGLQ